MRLEVGPGYSVDGKGYGFNPRLCGLSPDVVYLDVMPPAFPCRCDWVVADAQHLPFRSSVFREVHAHHVIEHLEDPVAFVREAARVLKRGGRLHVSTPNFLSRNAYRDPTHRHVFSFPRLWAMLRRAGLRPRTPAAVGSLLPRPLLIALKLLFLMVSDTLYLVGEKP